MRRRIRLLSEEEKARIRQAVKEGIPRGRLKVLALEMGRPSNTISAYIARIGATPMRARWTREELAIMEKQMAKGIPVLGIQQSLAQAGFQRSKSSIMWGQRRLGGVRRARDADGNYTAVMLGQALGVRRETVTAWIRRGWLRAKETDADWVIKPSAVKKFLIEYVHEINFAKVDKYFYTDILTGQVGEKI